MTFADLARIWPAKFHDCALKPKRPVCFLHANRAFPLFGCSYLAATRRAGPPTWSAHPVRHPACQPGLPALPVRPACPPGPPARGLCDEGAFRGRCAGVHIAAPVDMVINLACAAHHAA